MNTFRVSLSAAALSLIIVLTASADSHPSKARIDRGRYLVQVSGCNDCHTAGYLPSAGAIPESDWLKGDTLGWNGPWGTTYAINLRTFASKLTEEQWLLNARNTTARPPMPWWGLREMAEQDVRDIYAYIRSLPVVGPEAPAYLPPGEAPSTAYFTMIVPEKAEASNDEKMEPAT